MRGKFPVLGSSCDSGFPRLGVQSGSRSVCKAEHERGLLEGPGWGRELIMSDPGRALASSGPQFAHLQGGWEAFWAPSAVTF